MFSENWSTNKLAGSWKGADSSVNSVAVGQVFVSLIALVFEGSAVTCYYIAGSKSLPASFG